MKTVFPSIPVAATWARNRGTGRASRATGPLSFLTILLAVAGAGATLAAQGLRAELRTATDFGTYALEGNESSVAGWSRGHVLPDGLSSVVAGTGNTSAETLVRLVNDDVGGAVAGFVSEQGGGWALAGPMDVGSTAVLSAAGEPGAHSLRLTVRGPAHTRGKLEVWANGMVTEGATASMAIDVGADAIVDFAHQVTRAGSFDRRQWDTSLDAQGELVVAIATSARARAGTGFLSSYLTGITVRFTPGAFLGIAGYGTSCGPRLTAYDLAPVAGARELVVELGLAPANAVGVLVVGTRAVSLPIGGGCLLLAEPAATLTFATSAIGEANHHLRVPVTLFPFELRLQDIVLAGRGLTASNGVVVRWQP